MKSPNGHDQRRIPISHLQPSVDAESTSITGVITLVWPYSQSNNSFSLLLVEPDFRLRRERGQVRVHFRGSSARAAAGCGIGIGDEVTLSLVGVTWAKDDDMSKTPGRGIEWELQFDERVALTSSRASKEPIFLDIDHPTPPTELERGSPAIPQTPNPSHLAPISRLKPGAKPQTWSSPAFLKRSQLPYATYFRTPYDSAQGEGIFEESGRTKKLRFGRNSDQWVFTDVLPSPGPSDTQSRGDSKSASPAPHDIEKTQDSPIESSTYPPNIDHTPSTTNGQDQSSPVKTERPSSMSSSKSSLSNVGHTTFSPQNRKEISPVENEADPRNLEQPTLNRKGDEDDRGSLPVEAFADQRLVTSTSPSSPQALCGTDKAPSFQTQFPRQVSPEPENHHISEDQHPLRQENAQQSSLDLNVQQIQTLPRQGECFSIKVEQRMSEATEASEYTFATRAETSEAHLTQPSPSPNPVDSGHITSQFIPRDNIYERAISSVDRNEFEQVHDVIELSSGDSEENEDAEDSEDQAIDEDDESEEDGEIEDEDDLDEEAEDEEDEEAEDEEDEDEEERSDDEDDESCLRTFPHRYFHQSQDPRNLNLECTDSSEESEMHVSELDERSLEEEYTSSSQMLSIVDESVGDSSQNISEDYSLAEITDSGGDTFEDTSGVRPSIKGNHLPKSSEDHPYPPEKSENTRSTRNQVASSPHENAVEDDMPSAADVRYEGVVIDKQADKHPEGSSELHESEPSPEYGQPSNQRHLQDVEYHNPPDEQIKTMNEGTTDELASFARQSDAAIVEDGAGSRTAEALSDEKDELREDSIAMSKIGDSERIEKHPSSTQLDSYGNHPEKLISEHQEPDNRDDSKFAVPSGEEDAASSDESENRDRNLSSQKQMVEIIDLESEDSDSGAAEAWVKEEGSRGPAEANVRCESWPEEESAGGVPDMQSNSPHHSNDECRSETSYRENSTSVDNNQEIKPETFLTLSQTLFPVPDSPVLQDSSVQKGITSADSLALLRPSAGSLYQPSTLMTNEERLSDSNVDPILSAQIVTPMATQQRSIVFESSPISSQLIDEQHSLLTPRLTQNISATPLPPASPELPPTQTVIEKLKAMKSLSAEMARARTSSMGNAVGPWFVQKKESQMTHVSDSESEVASEVDVEAVTGQYHLIHEDQENQDEEDQAQEDQAQEDQAQEGLADKDQVQIDRVQEDQAQEDQAQEDQAQKDQVQKDQAQEDRATEDQATEDQAQEVQEAGELDEEYHHLIQSSHNGSPDQLPMPESVLPTTSATSPILSKQHPGFRTSFSYFAPLSTLCNHFNEHVDTLVIVLSSTDITMAQTGPRHWNKTISIIDPSSSSCSTNQTTIAQIFRRYKQALPFVRQGDAILLRDFKVQSFHNRLGLLSTDSSAWAVFRKGVDVQIQGPPVEFGAEERGFARGLWDWWGSVGEELRRGMEESAALAGETTTDEQKVIERTPEADNDDDVGGEVVTPTKSSKPKSRKRGRPSLGQGVVRHELRDGTSYTDSPRRGKANVHELRDGTRYSDSVEP